MCTLGSRRVSTPVVRRTAVAGTLGLVAAGIRKTEEPGRTVAAAAGTAEGTAGGTDWDTVVENAEGSVDEGRIFVLPDECFHLQIHNPIIGICLVYSK